jgi:3-deoxy-D-manno-octulosonate 8-phosphate phosphatase (KDO 8-P phosphatase)
VNREPTAAERAARVRLVIMDCDGVLTDGRAIYISSGDEALAFNVKDGTGIKYLQRAGLKTAILSGRDVEAVRARAQTLGIKEVVQGAKVKIDAYEQILAHAGLADEAVAYIGDDLPDLPVMRRVGLAAAVADAVPEVTAAAHLVTERRGGDGAVRELAEFILKAQGKWEEILRRYDE